jgi:hypothetical protein
VLQRPSDDAEMEVVGHLGPSDYFGKQEAILVMIQILSLFQAKLHCCSIAHALQPLLQTRC